MHLPLAPGDDTANRHTRAKRKRGDGSQRPLLHAFKLSHSVRYMPAAERDIVQTMIQNGHPKLVFLLQHINDHRLIVQTLQSYRFDVHEALLALVPNAFYQSKVDAFLSMHFANELPPDEREALAALLREPDDDTMELVLHCGSNRELWDCLRQNNFHISEALAAWKAHEKQRNASSAEPSTP